MDDSELLQRIASIRALFLDDQICEAKDALTLLESHLSPSQLSTLNSTPEISILNQDFASAQWALELLADYDSWELVNDTEEIATFFRGSGSEFFVRAEMIMDQPMFPVLALFSEIDLLSTWIKVLKRVDIISEPSGYRKVLKYVLELPWPASNRYILASAVGVAMRHNRSALIIFRDIEGDSYLGQQMPEPESGTVRINVDIGCINIMMLSPTQTQVSFVVKSHPHVSLIPKQLLNFAEKHIVFYLLEMIRKQCQNYSGSEYERRVSEVRTEYYEKLKGRIQQYTS